MQLNKGKLEALLGRYESLLKNVKTYVPNTLFAVEPVWGKLYENRCPLCGCKLKYPRTGKVAMCRSKKHQLPFIIKVETLRKVIHR